MADGVGARLLLKLPSASSWAWELWLLLSQIASSAKRHRRCVSRSQCREKRKEAEMQKERLEETPRGRRVLLRFAVLLTRLSGPSPSAGIATRRHRCALGRSMPPRNFFDLGMGVHRGACGGGTWLRSKRLGSSFKWGCRNFGGVGFPPVR